jgi:RNA polymerase sigma-70 factor, ECF subfamily
MQERDIFERHATQVLQFFVNKVRAPADANDLAQETFVRCFQRLRRGDVEHPRAFLFGVANFVLREYWTANARNQRRAPAAAGCDDFDPGSLSVVDMGAATTSISSMLAREQSHRRMLDAMRRLRLDYQNVLELRYWHDLSYAEIAEIFGESEQVVGIWIRRAKERLRRLLEQPAAAPAGAAATPFTPRALDCWLRRMGDETRASQEG